MIKELTGRHVAFILTGLFGTVFAVNGVFAYLAITGFPGLETRSAYRKGLEFNEQIARSATLKDLGWTMAVERSDQKTLTLRFTGKHGGPLQVDDVAVTLFHPTYAGGDKSLPVKTTAPGIVAAAVDPATKGNRQLRIRADGPGGRRLEFRRTIWLD